MPWLPYGINQHGELVSIWDTPRGKTDLACPYCGRALTAKRGDRLNEHFAHSGETCRAADRTSDVPTLPCYDNFNLHLSPREIEAVKRLHTKGAETLTDHEIERLIKLGLVQVDTRYWPHQIELTRLGSIPVGGLSLALFNQEQQPMIRARHAELEQKVKEAWKHRPVLLDETLVDLRLYRAQWRRILSSTLYCLEIQTPDKVLYKIGVTTREITERIAEIRHDLQKLYSAFHITVAGTWVHRGNVELYFKHRYARFRAPMGSLTEYFIFPNSKLVLADLNQMKLAVLRSDEQAVLAGEPAAIERKITSRIG